MQLKNMKEFVKNLSDEEVKELMYELSRSGKVVVSQFYRPSHIKHITNTEPTSELMLEIQSALEIDSELHEITYEKIVNILS